MIIIIKLFLYTSSASTDITTSHKICEVFRDPYRRSTQQRVCDANHAEIDSVVSFKAEKTSNEFIIKDIC